MTTITKGILLRIKQGDRLAFRALYDAYAPLLYDLGFRLLRDTAAAEELVQDCFVKVWSTRAEIQEDRDLWPLIYVMAKRLCFNQLRHARVTRKYLVEVTDVQVNDVEQRLDVRELESHLEHSIESLPEQQKRALRLSRLEGYSHQQIAAEMGISPNTVKNHITQALKNIRKTLPQADYNYLMIAYGFWLIANGL
ncbi:RNA polymerase sigma-70 factor [Sphingobacterium paucimobilis]|uniref:HTH luxR-type domain-containing protein n=1 Tax=Sphingobacterium paucimobilis HER1398 TaxID=1346330 RepID=U2H7R0_9SPHI|nr:RNA polymerase sigma-70 factor [Sphingobacterium paucimobilis]ERJ57746.1 hypothetical protein M472_03100 [Sphingobacterium paucimobilis HER1398]